MTTGIHCLDSCEHTPQPASQPEGTWHGGQMRARGYNHSVEHVLYLDTGEQDMAPIESPLVTLLPYLRRLLLLTEVAVPSD